MTTWFDNQQRALRALSELRCEETRIGALCAFECYIVRALTIAVELQGAPEDLRDAIHHAVLRYGVATLPANAPRGDYDTTDEYAGRISEILNAGHSAFHEFARRTPGASDDPEQRLQSICDAGEDRRVALYAASEHLKRAHGTP